MLYVVREGALSILKLHLHSFFSSRDEGEPSLNFLSIGPLISIGKHPVHEGTSTFNGRFSTCDNCHHMDQSGPLLKDHSPGVSPRIVHTYCKCMIFG